MAMDVTTKSDSPRFAERRYWDIFERQIIFVAALEDFILFSQNFEILYYYLFKLFFIFKQFYFLNFVQKILNLEHGQVYHK